MPDSLHCVFCSREIDRRSLVAATLKPTKTTPDTEAVEIRDQMLHKPFNAVDANLIRASIGESCAIILMVSVKDPHAPTMAATGFNALEYLMRQEQPVRCRHNSSAHWTCRVG